MYMGNFLWALNVQIQTSGFGHDLKQNRFHFLVLVASKAVASVSSVLDDPAKVVVDSGVDSGAVGSSTTNSPRYYPYIVQ